MDGSYLNIFGSVKDIVYVHGQDGRILGVNDSVTYLLGYRAEEVTGKSIFDFFFYAGRRDPNLVMTRVSERGTLSGRVSLRSKNGDRRVFEYRSSWVLGDDKAMAFYGVARDVTSQLDLRRAVRRSERHYTQLSSQVAALRPLLASLTVDALRVREDERRSISRELHDEIGQVLTAIDVSLSMMRKSIVSDEPISPRRVDDLRGLVKQAYEYVHHVARDLRPALLDELGLLPAIRGYAKSFSDRTGISVLFHEDSAVESLNRDRKVVLYRVVQESLTNVSRHANARQVEITLGAHGGIINMGIRDNGDAFRADASSSWGMGTRGLGILGMQERVRAVNGNLEIESERGRGTTINVTIPVEKCSTQNEL
jgi:PAS domain S-box-containing protein